MIVRSFLVVLLSAQAVVAEPALQPAPTRAAMSAVHGKLAQPTNVRISNPTDAARPMAVAVSGKDAAHFTVAAPAEVPAGGAVEVAVTFHAPDRPGLFEASLNFGDGAAVPLRAIGLAAFEGKNEPALQTIVNALAIPLDVGGKKLELDTKAATIGQSVAATTFRAAGPGKIRITPVARFSPPGVTPFGWVAAGSEELVELGQLADSTDGIPDAHQCLFPPLVGGATVVEIDAPEGEFSFYMKGHKFVSHTDPRLPTKATIPHTARIWPVTSFLGRELRHAWLVGFEEASNGDYQDAVFLVENLAEGVHGRADSP